MKITAKFFFVFLALTLFLGVYFHYSYITFEEESLQTFCTEKIRNTEEIFTLLVKNSIDQMQLAIPELLKDPKTLSLFLEKNRGGLYEHALPFSEKVKRNYGFSQIHFIDPEGHIFLRMHKKETYDDLSLHSIFFDTKKNAVPSFGFDLGKVSFSFRGVFPLLKEGQIMGYIELDLPADHFLKNLKAISRDNYLFLLQKNYLNSENWLLLQQSFKARGLGEEIENQVVLASTLSGQSLGHQSFEGMSHLPGSDREFKILKQADRYFIMGKIPLFNSENVRIGNLISLSDFTHTILQNRAMLLTRFGVTLVFLFLAAAIHFFIAHQFSKSIKKIKAALEKMRSGDFHFPIVHPSRDETGEILELLNQTAKSFRGTLEEIHTYTKRLESEGAVRMKELILTRSELEKKVQERTAELTKSQTAMLYMIEDLNRQAEQLRQVQSKMVRSEKLAAIGQLSSSVAHELRNPLGVMKNAVYYLNMLELGKTNPDIQENLNILSQEIESSNKIISDLLEFSRINKPTLRVENIHDILKETLKRLDFPTSIRLETAFDESIPLMSLDALQIQQVFYNLILNGIQAMESGGVLKITTRKEAGFAEILFSDNGSGISKENLGKIFEPLFTTKAKGTGLGLPVCASLIAGHHGKIEVESELGIGTLFSVKLPLPKSGG